MINTDENYLYADLTEKILGCSYSVYNILGSGFLEKVHGRRMKINPTLTFFLSLKERKLSYSLPFKWRVGWGWGKKMFSDEKVIVELKAVNEPNKVHEVQLVNYLKATHSRSDC